MNSLSLGEDRDNGLVCLLNWIFGSVVLKCTFNSRNCSSLVVSLISFFKIRKPSDSVGNVLLRELFWFGSFVKSCPILSIKGCSLRSIGFSLTTTNILSFFPEQVLISMFIYVEFPSDSLRWLG
jgi:hypothetical protein